MPRSSDDQPSRHSGDSGSTRASASTRVTTSTPATTPSPGSPGNFLDMHLTPPSTPGSARSTAAGSAGSAASAHGSPGAMPPSPPAAGPSGYGAGTSNDWRQSDAARYYGNSGTSSPAGTAVTSPRLSPAVSYYDPPGSGQHSPALPSSGTRTRAVSPSQSGAPMPGFPRPVGSSNAYPSVPNSYQGTPLPSSGVRSHYDSPSRGGPASPAYGDSGMQSNYGGRSPQEGAAARADPRVVPVTFPAGYQPFGGAFSGHPENVRRGSAQFPRPSPQAYEKKGRPKTG